MSTASTSTSPNFTLDISELPHSLEICSITWQGKTPGRYLVPKESNIQVIDSIAIKRLTFSLPPEAKELSISCLFQNEDLRSNCQSIQFQRPKGDRLFAKISGDTTSIKLKSIKATKAAESATN